MLLRIFNTFWSLVVFWKQDLNLLEQYPIFVNISTKVLRKIQSKAWILQKSCNIFQNLGKNCNFKIFAKNLLLRIRHIIPRVSTFRHIVEPSCCAWRDLSESLRPGASDTWADAALSVHVHSTRTEYHGFGQRNPVASLSPLSWKCRLCLKVNNLAVKKRFI